MRREGWCERRYRGKERGGVGMVEKRWKGGRSSGKTLKNE